MVTTLLDIGSVDLGIELETTRIGDLNEWTVVGTKIPQMQMA